MMTKSIRARELQEGPTLTRRQALAGSVAATAMAVGWSGRSRAQAKEIVIGAAASHKPWMDTEIIPTFEKKYGAKIIFEGTRSTVNLQKLQSNKASPTTSVVMMDDPVMISAKDEGLLEKLDPIKVPNLGKLKPGTVHYDGQWANYLQPWAGVGYNTQKVPGGVHSWAELWDAKFKGRLAIPSLQNTDGVFVLLMASHLATGKPFGASYNDVDAAFQKLAELKPSLLTIYTNLPQTSNLLEQGEAHLMVSFSSFVLFRKAEKVPIDLAAPKEGVFAMPSGIAVVKGGPNQDLAFAFVNEMLGAEFQGKIAPRTFSLPTNTATATPAGMPASVAVHLVDWAWFNRNRSDLIARWDKTMAL